MSKHKMGYTTIFLIFVLCLLMPSIPKTNGKYITKLTKHLIIEAQQPKYIVKFYANNGTNDYVTQEITYNTYTNLRNNTFTNEQQAFLGWNTEANGSGESFYNGQSVHNLVQTNGGVFELYAQWTDKVAKIGDTYYDSLQAAINAAYTMSGDIEVILLKNASENVVVPNNSSKKLTLNLYGHTLQNNGNYNTIKNNGILVLKNGNINNTAETNGAINNYSTGKMEISDVYVEVTGTGNRQALYNENGEATICSGTTLKSKSTQRPAVTNKGSGKMYILGGEIESTAQQGLINEGTLVIGNPEDEVNTNNPSIKGLTFGLQTNKNISFYDGTILGKTQAVDNPNRITTVPEGYHVVTTTDGTYKESHLELKLGVAQIGDTYYQSLQEAIDAAGTGDIGTSILLLTDTIEAIKYDKDIEVSIDLNGNTVTTSGNHPVFIQDINENNENAGTLNLSNGVIVSNANQAVINNFAGTLNIENLEVRATGNRQALYVTGGVVNIKEGSNLSSYTYGTPVVDTHMDRGTVQVTPGGSLNVFGGTITAINQHGISNEGTLTIGTYDGNVSTSTPIITGEKDGVKSNVPFNFYDGVIEGKENAINTVNFTQDEIVVEDNYEIVESEIIDDETQETYHVAQLESVSPSPNMVMPQSNTRSINELDNLDNDSLIDEDNDKIEVNDETNEDIIEENNEIKDDNEKELIDNQDNDESENKELNNNDINSNNQEENDDLEQSNNEIIEEVKEDIQKTENTDEIETINEEKNNQIEENII